MNIIAYQGHTPAEPGPRVQTMQAGVDGLIVPLIFVAVMISKIVKAARDAQRQAPGGDAPKPVPRPPSGNDQAEELRQFLERLGAPVPPAQPPEPPPPPPVAQPRQPVRARSPKPAAAPKAMRVKAPMSQIRPTPQPTRDRPTPEPQVHAHVHCGTKRKNREERAARSRRALIGHLDDASSLRRAILHREILGPPLAMGSERR